MIKPTTEHSIKQNKVIDSLHIKLENLLNLQNLLTNSISKIEESMKEDKEKNVGIESLVNNIEQSIKQLKEEILNEQKSVLEQIKKDLSIPSVQNNKELIREDSKIINNQKSTVVIIFFKF